MQEEKKKARKKAEELKKRKSPALSTLPSETNDKTDDVKTADAGAVAKPERFDKDLVEKGVGDITDGMKDLLNDAADDLEEQELQDKLLESIDQDFEDLQELENEEVAGLAGEKLGGLKELDRPAFNPMGPICDTSGKTITGPVKPKNKRTATPINSSAYLTMKKEAIAKLNTVTSAMSKPLDLNNAIQWDSSSVKRWGKEQLPEKYHKFWSAGVEANQTTGKDLLTLDHDELKAFGFKVGVFRRNILRKIGELKTGTATT